jgi:hypothetical protein
MWIAAIVVAGAVAYSNSLTGSFVFDDTPGIVDNPNIRRVWPFVEAMSAPAEVTVSGRPVASLTLALNYALAPADARDVLRAPSPFAPAEAEIRYRRNVWGYHLVNLLIHLAAGLTLFGLIRRTLIAPRLSDRFATASASLAGAIALLWVVHPLQTESVTYVIQRVEALMGLFYLLTLYCAIRAREAATGRWWSAAAVVACALGMGSKEVMVSAPLMVITWDWLFSASRADKPRWRWRLYLALSTTWVLLAALVLFEQRPHSVGVGLDGWSSWSYLMTQASVILHYLRLAIVPVPLVIDYDWPRAASLAAAAPAVAVVAAMATATALGVMKRRPEAFLGAWFFMILAPTSSVLPITTEVAAEHRMYLPLAAVLAAVVLGASQLAHVALAGRARALGRWTAASWQALGLVAVTFGLLTHARNETYRTEDALWRDTVTNQPSNVRARVAYGKVLHLARRYAEAESELREAVRLGKDDSTAHLNLGATLAAQRKFAEGVPHLERALALDGTLAEAHANLGEA